jgi:hypothetical protein
VLQDMVSFNFCTKPTSPQNISVSGKW